MFSVPRPETMINLMAGLVSYIFERVQDGSQVPDQPINEPDDLTVIGGIGPTFAQRLNDAGILSYGQLANLEPDQVVEITHVAKWQADPAEWIKQAQAFV